MTSSIGPMTKKAKTGDKPKLAIKELPMKASASLQSESRKDSSMSRRIATAGVELIEVRILVGT